MPSRDEGDAETPWDGGVPIPSVLLSRAPCGSCGKQDVLIPDWTLVRDGDLVRQWMVWNRPLVDYIVVQGNTCFNCVKLLYEQNRLAAVHGGDIDSDGNTLLHYAARSGNFRMLYHLICLVREKHNRRDVAKVIRRLNGARETALHEAIRLENKCMVGLLMWADRLLAKYPIPDPDHPNVASPLYLAVSLKNEHIAGLLYEKSGGSLSYCGPNGQNALHAAALHLLEPAAALQAHGMVEMLLRWKKDLVEEKDNQGRIPLHYVAMEGFWPKQGCMHPRYDKMLRRATCLLLGDVEQVAAFQQDEEGFSPLHMAALTNSKVPFHILVSERRGCIGLRDKSGRTFLHIAVQNKMCNIVNYSCKEVIFEPIWNARDNDGNTALHLAAKVGELSILCALMTNRKVQLDIRNNEDETPLDLASTEGRPVFSYKLNSKNVIYWTLVRAGGLRGKVIPLGMSTTKPDEKKNKEKEDKEKKDSDQMNDSTRTLGLASVLIASVTFTASFTVPTAIKASTASGIPALLVFGTWYFKAFMMANTLAFICALTATAGLMFSGMSMVELQMRRIYFKISTYFTKSAFTCWTVAFAAGVYMVLGPVNRTISSVIFITSAVLLLLLPSADFLKIILLTARPLYARRGLIYVSDLFMGGIFWNALFAYWPIVVTLAVAASR